MISKDKAKWKEDLNEIYKEKPVIVRPRIVFTQLARLWKGGASLHFFILINPALKDAVPEARYYLLAHEYGHVYKCHILHGIKMLISFWAFFLWLGAAFQYVSVHWYLLGLFVLGSLLYYFNKKVNIAEDEADEFAIKLKGSKVMYNGCSWVGEKLNDINDARKKKLIKYKNYKD